VRLFHPDGFEGQPERMGAYTALTSAINKAKDDDDEALNRTPTRIGSSKVGGGLAFEELKAQQQRNENIPTSDKFDASLQESQL
jgi:hypothetical protein